MMDSRRFSKFKEEADLLLKSSTFITHQIDKIIEDCADMIQNPHLYSAKQLENLEAKLLNLQAKCRFETNATNEFRDKYKDYINEDR